MAAPLSFLLNSCRDFCLSPASGSSHMALYLRLHQGSTLSTWSLGNGTPLVNSLNGDYFVYYARGLRARPWHFWIELKVSLFFKHHIHFLELSSLLQLNGLSFGYSLLIHLHLLKLTHNCFLLLLILIRIFFSLGVLDMTSFYLSFQEYIKSNMPLNISFLQLYRQQIEINPVLLYLLT